MIPAALASVGFLLTFTIRSWHDGLWRPGQAADPVIVSTPRQPAASRATPLAARRLGSALPLASVLQQEAVQLRAVPMPAASAVAPAASDYLAERDREVSHSGRLR
jgi:hypothetical protein